jgi:hypothetical protein
MKPIDSWSALAARTTRMLVERTTRVVNAVPESHGNCQASISGAVSLSFRGDAEFAGPHRSHGPGIVLHLRDRSGTSAIDLIYRGATLPVGVAGVGDAPTVPSGTGEWLGLYSTSDGEELSEVFFAVGGEVRLHPLAGGYLGGQFAFQARSGPQDPSTSRSVTVAGYFCARPAGQPLPITAGRLTWDWDFSGLGLDEADLGFN